MKGGFCLARRRWVPAKGKQNERKQNRNFQKIKWSVKFYTTKSMPKIARCGKPNWKYMVRKTLQSPMSIQPLISR
jgi:hypothetical protein